MKDGNKITYRQTYIISIKYESDEGVFCYPIVYAMMRNKSKLSYTKLLEHLAAIHAKYNPEFEPLIPRVLSCDMEHAVVLAFKQFFDSKYNIDLQVRLCSFHLKQAFKRFIDNEWKKIGGHYKERNQIQRHCCSMVFSPFVLNPMLRSRFAAILMDEVATKSSKVRSAVTNLIEFLNTNYLVMHEDQSFKYVSNWNYFNDVLCGEPDTTNNTSESINRKFNHEIKLGFKSFKKVSISIFNNKKHYIDKLHETVQRNRL